MQVDLHCGHKLGLDELAHSRHVVPRGHGSVLAAAASNQVAAMRDVSWLCGDLHCYGQTVSLTDMACALHACRTGERIAFSHLISNKFVGETARLKVLRGGEELTVDVGWVTPATRGMQHCLMVMLGIACVCTLASRPQPNIAVMKPWHLQQEICV